MGKKIHSIGRYTLDGTTLGKGNFAHVELATHGITKIKVAIKIIDTKKIKDEYVRGNLHREAKIMASLRHPNITRLYETLKATTLYCLVTEYAPGGDLLSYIKEQKNCRLTENAARTFIRQLVSALHYLHEIAIVHRDLKMENVMLDEKQRNIKLIDFGLSNIIKEDERLKTHCGSPEYAAPELFVVGKTYGPEIDIWSLGIITYAMILGRLPFCTVFSDEYHRQRMLQQIQKGLSPMHDREMQTLSTDCRNLIHQLIEPNPELRIPLPEIELHAWVTKNGKYQFIPYTSPPRNKHLRNQVVVELANLMDMKKGVVNETVKENRGDELSAMFNMMMEQRKKDLGWFEIDHTKKPAVQDSNGKLRSEPDQTDHSDAADQSHDTLDVVRLKPTPIKRAPVVQKAATACHTQAKPKSRSTTPAQKLPHKTAAKKTATPPTVTPKTTTPTTPSAFHLVTSKCKKNFRAPSTSTTCLIQLSSDQPHEDEVAQFELSQIDETAHPELSHEDNVAHSVLAKRDEVAHSDLPIRDEVAQSGLSIRDEVAHSDLTNGTEHVVSSNSIKINKTVSNGLSVGQPGIKYLNGLNRGALNGRITTGKLSLTLDLSITQPAPALSQAAGTTELQSQSTNEAISDDSLGYAACCGVPPELSPRDANKGAIKIASTAPKIKTPVSQIPKSVVSRARRPSSLQYSLKLNPPKSKHQPAVQTGSDSRSERMNSAADVAAAPTAAAPAAADSQTAERKPSIATKLTPETDQKLGWGASAAVSRPVVVRANVKEPRRPRTIHAEQRLVAPSENTSKGRSDRVDRHLVAPKATPEDSHIEDELSTMSDERFLDRLSDIDDELDTEFPLDDIEVSCRTSESYRSSVACSSPTRPEVNCVYKAIVDVSSRTSSTAEEMYGKQCCDVRLSHIRWQESRLSGSGTSFENFRCDSLLQACPRSLSVSEGKELVSGISLGSSMVDSQSDTDTINVDSHPSVNRFVSASKNLVGEKFDRCNIAGCRPTMVFKRSGLSPGSPSYAEHHFKFSHIGANALDMFASPADLLSPIDQMWRPVVSTMIDSPTKQINHVQEERNMSKVVWNSVENPPHFNCSSDSVSKTYDHVGSHQPELKQGLETSNPARVCQRFHTIRTADVASSLPAQVCYQSHILREIRHKTGDPTVPAHHLSNIPSGQTAEVSHRKSQLDSRLGDVKRQKIAPIKQTVQVEVHNDFGSNSLGWDRLCSSDLQISSPSELNKNERMTRSLTEAAQQHLTREQIHPNCSHSLSTDSSNRMNDDKVGGDSIPCGNIQTILSGSTISTPSSVAVKSRQVHATADISETLSRRDTHKSTTKLKSRIPRPISMINPTRTRYSAHYNSQTEPEQRERRSSFETSCSSPPSICEKMDDTPPSSGEHHRRQLERDEKQRQHQHTQHQQQQQQQQQQQPQPEQNHQTKDTITESSSWQRGISRWFHASLTKTKFGKRDVSISAGLNGANGGVRGPSEGLNGGANGGVHGPSEGLNGGANGGVRGPSEGLNGGANGGVRGPCEGLNGGSNGDALPQGGVNGFHGAGSVCGANGGLNGTGRGVICVGGNGAGEGLNRGAMNRIKDGVMQNHHSVNLRTTGNHSNNNNHGNSSNHNNKNYSPQPQTDAVDSTEHLHKCATIPRDGPEETPSSHGSSSPSTKSQSKFSRLRLHNFLTSKFLANNRSSSKEPISSNQDQISSFNQVQRSK